LYKPRDTYRTNVGGWSGTPAVFNFYLANKADTNTLVKLQILESSGKPIITYSNKPEKKERKFQPKKGMNQLSWDLEYPGPEMAENFVAMVFNSDAPGPTAVPGKYMAILNVNGNEERQSFSILPDPRWKDVTQEDYQAQFDLAVEMADLITRSQKQIKNIRSIREQVNNITKLAVLAGKGDGLTEAAEALSNKLTAVEDSLFQNKIEVSQDEINYPRRFTNHIARLYRVVIDDHHKPTGGMLERYQDLKNDYKRLISPLSPILENDLKAFNAKVKSNKIEAVIIPYED
jgi:hypothetical protein